MAADEDTQPPTPTPQDEQPRARLTDRERRALAFSGSAVGVVSGVSAFLSAYFDSGLTLFAVSALVVAVGLILAVGSMRLWDLRGRTVTVSVSVIVVVVVLLVGVGAAGGALGQSLGLSARPSPTPSSPASQPVMPAATPPVSEAVSTGPSSASPAPSLPGPILGPNLFGLKPDTQITIDKAIRQVGKLDTIRGRSEALCCDQTIWILVQRVGYAKVFPQGYCDLQNKEWTCKEAQFGEAADVGTEYWVTAVVILNSQEDLYRKVYESGYSHDSPPIKPVRVSDTITVERI